jgi:hypothetical protein
MQDDPVDGCMYRLDFNRKLTSTAHYWNSSLPGKILRFVKLLTERLMYMYLHRIDVQKPKIVEESEREKGKGQRGLGEQGRSQIDTTEIHVESTLDLLIKTSERSEM